MASIYAAQPVPQHWHVHTDSEGIAHQHFMQQAGAHRDLNLKPACISHGAVIQPLPAEERQCTGHVTGDLDLWCMRKAEQLANTAQATSSISACCSQNQQLILLDPVNVVQEAALHQSKPSNTLQHTPIYNHRSKPGCTGQCASNGVLCMLPCKLLHHQSCKGKAMQTGA